MPRLYAIFSTTPFRKFFFAGYPIHGADLRCRFTVQIHGAFFIELPDAYLPLAIFEILPFLAMGGFKSPIRLDIKSYAPESETCS